MDGLRVLLIIVGLLVILAALAHGLWSIRKNSRKQRVVRKAEPSLTPTQSTPGATDSSGFDEFGIGAVRTIKTADSKAAKQPAKADTAKKEVQQPTLFDEGGSEPANVATSAKATPERQEPEVAVEQLPMSFPEEEQKQPSISSEALPEHAEEKTPELGALDLEESAEEPAEEATAAEQTNTPNTEKEPQVISLYVSGDIQGAILLQTVTELGFKFGDMDIFHRHVDTAGKGPTLFSMANMFNPGVFDLDEIETFSTRGVVLFMELPVPGDGHKAFTMMYNAANKIAEAMPRAAVLDSNRNPITKQSVQHTYQRIREFERQQHVAGAAGMAQKS
ncbi:cell division protein ZipA [Aliidiomarina taiwanensis]|uniref:Cell division protein ZipA n=1 Tax=Aliidiomarina taiwanensis TaxID=946228 RepID=A0A432X1P7_9GAMM|nr:cell division protein ZipA [Aliidiomarina taiwanensis]RUO40501.1 cell division protein ZipA [Aliidiomarina taiwanensis]